jgi:uncharacterized cofD-like protein
MKKRKRIVTIGGGTGSFTLLSGLKRFPVDISAIVSMADDGGSTGVLRDELGVLPPGDVRQCLVALSESSERLRELMNYRFDEGGLSGHSFGNLFLSALEKVNGSFAKGVEEAMDILNVKGEVIPVTEQDVSLSLRLSDGEVLEGENEINQSRELQSRGIGAFGFPGRVRAYAKAIARVRQADMVVIGPGNLYCSLLPNLIIRDFAEAIRTSGAEVVYVANLTNKAGHTLGWNIDGYVREIERYIGRGRTDAVVWNAARIDPSLVRKYERSEGKGAIVGSGSEDASARAYRLVRADVVSRVLPRADKSDRLSRTRAFIRHDPERLARAIMFLLESKENAKVIMDHD